MSPDTCLRRRSFAQPDQHFFFVCAVEIVQKNKHAHSYHVSSSAAVTLSRLQKHLAEKGQLLSWKDFAPAHVLHGKVH